MSQQSIRKLLEPATTAGIVKAQSWINTDSTRVHYRWDGPLDKPVLVLSNSLGTNLSMWDPQMAELTKHYRILRYDTRGHGLSAVSSGPYTIQLLGQDVIDLLNALDVESCYFCGLSMGGMIGQWLGAHTQSRIRKLILCNTAARLGTAEAWNARIETVLKDGVPAVVEAVLERWFTPGFRQTHPETVRATAHMLNAMDRFGYTAACAAVRDMDLRESAKEIGIPTLVIAGTHDPVTPPSDGKDLASRIDGAQYVELNAAHLSNVEMAENFTASVLKFLEH